MTEYATGKHTLFSDKGVCAHHILSATQDGIYTQAVPVDGVWEGFHPDTCPWKESAQKKLAGDRFIAVKTDSVDYQFYRSLFAYVEKMREHLSDASSKNSELCKAVRELDAEKNQLLADKITNERVTSIFAQLAINDDKDEYQLVVTDEAVLKSSEMMVAVLDEADTVWSLVPNPEVSAEYDDMGNEAEEV